MGASQATRLAILTAMDGDSTSPGRAGETPIYIMRPEQTMPLDRRRLFVKTLNEDDHCAISEGRAVGVVTTVWRISHRLSNQRRPIFSQHENQTTLHQYHLLVGDG
jgi:hypothetical protein